MKKCVFIVVFVSFLVLTVRAQNREGTVDRKAYPDFVDRNDSMGIFVFPDVYVFPKTEFKDVKEEEQYKKLIRDVKKTLPYAKLIYATLIETYEYMETLPDDKAREEHMKLMEKDLYKEYLPVLKKMSFSQGKLLIKLIDRECNQSSYDLVKAFLGPFRAGFWNLFAGMFGANLKSRWDPKGKDILTERIVVLVERGAL